jgi:signal peptidase II
MAHRSFRWVFVSLALVGLATDQASKYGVFRWLASDTHTGQQVQGEYSVVSGVFEFRLVAQFDLRAERSDNPLVTLNGPVPPHVNHGALFGLGGENQKPEYQRLANRIFAGISLLAAAAIIFWSRRPSARRDAMLCAALGLILAGTLGNLYDRVVFGGVRDFMHFFIERSGKTTFDWPVFNVADCCLVAGAGLLLIQALFFRPKKDEPVAETPAPGTTAEELKASGVV